MFQVMLGKLSALTFDPLADPQEGANGGGDRPPMAALVTNCLRFMVGFSPMILGHHFINLF
jgi:hypothetical protein